MAVKRLTIELDDITDVHQPTTSPATLLPQQTLPLRRGETELPSRQADYQESQINPSSETGHSAEAIGRTPADLVFAFVNKPEFMSTFFVFLAFIVSVARLQKMADLWITASIAIGLNAVWFGIIGVRLLFARLARRQ